MWSAPQLIFQHKSRVTLLFNKPWHGKKGRDHWSVWVRHRGVGRSNTITGKVPGKGQTIQILRWRNEPYTNCNHTHTKTYTYHTHYCIVAGLTNIPAQASNPVNSTAKLTISHKPPHQMPHQSPLPNAHNHSPYSNIGGSSQHFQSPIGSGPLGSGTLRAHQQGQLIAPRS